MGLIKGGDGKTFTRGEEIAMKEGSGSADAEALAKAIDTYAKELGAEEVQSVTQGLRRKTADAEAAQRAAEAETSRVTEALAAATATQAAAANDIVNLQAERDGLKQALTDAHAEAATAAAKAGQPS